MVRIANTTRALVRFHRDHASVSTFHFRRIAGLELFGGFGFLLLFSFVSPLSLGGNTLNSSL